MYFVCFVGRTNVVLMRSVPPAVAGGSPKNPSVTAGGTDLIAQDDERLDEISRRC